MKAVSIILMGFGNVGQAFLRVAHEKKELCAKKYGLHIRFYSIFELGGAIHSSRPLNRSKILIISNALMKTDFTLDDMTVEGIDVIPPHLLTQGRKKDRALKLLGILFKRAEELRLEVRLTVIDSSHPLFGVDGTNKGIVFTTDTMDSVTVTGGKSDPKGAGASLLKDIINIYRKEF